MPVSFIVSIWPALFAVEVGEEIGLLRDLLIVFAVAGSVVFLFQHLRVPAVIGLLVSGALVGPYGLSLVAEVEQVRFLAEIGVVVLLFTVGLDFSLSRLLRMWQTMLAVGGAEVLLSGTVVALATGWYLGGIGPGIFAGMLVAMSSTAVVLKILTDRSEINSPHGRLSVAVLLLQDLLMVVFMLLLPLLSDEAGAGESVLVAFGKGIGVVGLVILAARYLVPPVLYRVVRTRNRELFLILIVLLCLGTAALTAWAGLSLALGAFLAGLAISESEYAHQTLAEVLPFRDTLSSLFFVSVGMLLNVQHVFANFPLVSLTVVAIMLLKFVVVAIPVWLSGYTVRVALLSGLSLLQIGEFSFVLAGRGVELALLEPSDYQIFLAAAVITMALTPLCIAAGPKIADFLPESDSVAGVFRRFRLHEDEESAVQMSDHVIIAGYGINGRNVARALRDSEIRYVILEMNPQTVRRLRRAGEPIYFGDCSRPAVLEHLGIARARVLVVAISDPSSTRRAVQAARHANSQVHIIVRTRYVAEVDELRTLGADEIIPEEFETSLEIFARVLGNFQVPRNVVLEMIDRIRQDHYDILRDSSLVHQAVRMPVDVLSNMNVESVLIRESSPAVDRSLGEMNLRRETGATVLAVRRNGELLTNPGATYRFQPGDVTVLVGEPGQVVRALCLLDPTVAAPQEPGQSDAIPSSGSTA